MARCSSIRGFLLTSLASLAMLLVLAPAARAQRRMSVAQLEAFIKSSIQLNHPDRQVADIVEDLELTDRLTASAVETLQGLGAGPRTVRALEKLSEASADLALPPPAVQAATRPTIPAPSEAERAEILAEIRRNALEYTEGLPNFICTQITRRYFDPTGAERWRRADTIQEQLSYVDQKENYRVVLINNLPVTDVKHEELGGTVTSGEWGTMLYDIFKAATRTEFEWDHWATLRGRRMYVFSYRVRKPYSEYSVYDGESKLHTITGYHGLIYADRDTKRVMRIRMDADDLLGFPIQEIAMDLDYDTVEISGREFVLPLKVSTRSRAGRFLSRNEVEFRRYSRFTADAEISFDIPDELPPEQFEEQPAEPEDGNR